jgi:hypothetical protein
LTTTPIATTLSASKSEYLSVKDLNVMGTKHEKYLFRACAVNGGLKNAVFGRVKKGE